MTSTVLHGTSASRSAIGASQQQDFSGVVHSVYDHALNFSDTSGRLYTILPDSMDDGPDAVRLERTSEISFRQLGITSGSSVSVAAGSFLFTNRLRVDMTRVVPWESRLPAFPLPNNIHTLRENLAVLRSVILSHGKAGGMKVLYGEHGSTAGTSLFERELGSRAHRLLATLRNDHRSEAYIAALNLVGFGLGSTPSGDDFLTGLFTVWNMPGGPFASFRALARQLACLAEHRTTAVSHAMLAHAASGQARGKIIALLEAATTKTKQETARFSGELLSIGSMSGTDLAAGIHAGLELGLSLIQSEERKNVIVHESGCEEKFLS